MKFRRNTHDLDGRYREETFGYGKQSPGMEWIWSEHGHIVHLLDSSKGMTFNQVMNEIRADTTNYSVVQEGPADDRSMIPNPQEVAYGLVRLIEVGYVEVVE